MNGIKTEEARCEGIKFIIEHEGNEIARAYLYLMHNDLHQRPFGFMEDVYVDPSLRGMGHGSELVNTVISEARRRMCYKLICTSRHSKPKVHELYRRLGFEEHGLEFRMNLDDII